MPNIAEEEELQKLLDDNPSSHGDEDKVECVKEEPKAQVEPKTEKERVGQPTQYATSDGRTFSPCSKTFRKLAPGAYQFVMTDYGPIYVREDPNPEPLVRFPDTNIEECVKGIERFWELEDHFREHKLTYKRGILLWGPPGSGKSCALRLVCEDVIKRGGIVVTNFNGGFLQCYNIFRQIQPNTPLVVLMEDLDTILEVQNESRVLNTLDGIHKLDKVVFLATTNYPEKLGPRIINRPSRFDKRIKIGYPNERSRRIYLKFIWDEIPKDTLDKWVRDTDKFTFVHLKELFIAMHLYEADYDEALTVLRSMSRKISSVDDDEKAGFGIKWGGGGKANNCDCSA